MADIIKQFTYPDLAFAFNPIPVEVITDMAREVRVSIYLESTDPLEDPKTTTLIRNTFKGKDGKHKVVFDLSGIARSLFDRDEFSSIKKKIFYEKGEKVREQDSELLKIVSGTIASGGKIGNEIKVDFKQFSIPVFWGALQIGENYSQTKCLTYFRGYPFTVPLFLPPNTEKNEGIVEEYELRFSNEKETLKGGKYNLDVTGNIPSDKNRYRIAVLGKPENGEDPSFFDYTFDYTFRKEAVRDIYLDIDVEDCLKEGYYLRWINRHGEWNYYLFHKKAESTQTSDSNIVFDNYFTSIGFSNGYHAGTGKPVGKDVKKTIQLYAALVDTKTFDFLTQMVQSPVVDLFMGYETDKDGNTTENWMGVKTQAGTFAKSNAHLQDFEFTMMLPEVFTQNL